MNKTLIYAALTFILCVSHVATAFSQVKPETLVKERQSAMILMSKYFDNQLRPMARGTVPYDATIVERNAGYLDVLIKMPWEGFDPATKGIKSRSTPATFTDTAKFKDAQDRAQGEIAKLVAVSKGGTEAAVKSQIEGVNKACGSCHETFRERQ